MKCPSCQHENPPGLKFCGECGARLTLACPACGSPNPPGQKFCGECGKRLTEAQSAAQPASPDSYTPRHLAERILNSKSALEGERKQVTVLFADLKGSMELLADRDPEEARKILDPVLDRMMEAVHRYEGTVNQVMGDGIMALFGAPLALEDHAVRACYAALAMQAAIRRYSDGLRESQGIEIQIRVGLNSGEVVVRSIGNDLRMDYSAIGQTTHLASRMEQLAIPGTIRMSADTLRLAEGFVQVAALGRIPVKGLHEPVDIFELTGAHVARTRMQAAASRGLTRFVGRNEELQSLWQALKRAEQGHGQIVALVGEPGVGKSRLVWEFSHSYRTQGWLKVESGSVSYGKATAYRPVIDMLKAYFQIEERDDRRRIQEKVTGKLLTLDEAFKPVIVPILALLDVSIDEPEWVKLDPPQRRQRILDACKRLVLRESQIQPLLLIYEDLHWIDTETQAFLDGLVENLPAARILLLVNYRPEYVHRWTTKTYYIQLRVDPLAGETAEALLQAILGTDSSLLPLKHLLIERTEGNPLFLEESVRTLIETGAFQGDRGAYRLGAKLSNIQVSATVQAILAARIDRLAPENKRLLQMAAVIGKDVPYVLLKAIAEVPEDQLRHRLAALQTAEFLYETSLFPNLEYTFKHALTHEVTYGSLLHDHRRAVHAAIVEAIETQYSTRIEEHVEAMAHHALRGEQWERAAGFLRQAGEKAAARSANREAIAFIEQALGALARLPQQKEHIEPAIDLRFRLRTSLIQIGELAAIFHRMQEAETLAHAIGDTRRLAWAHLYLSHYFSTSGNPQRAVEVGQTAVTSPEVRHDLAFNVASRFFLGVSYFELGEYEKARVLYLDNVRSIPGNLTYEHFGLAGPAAAWSRSQLVGVLAELGDFTEARAQGEEAIHISRDANHSYAICGAHLYLGWSHMRQGNFAIATDYLERGLSITRERDLSFFALQISMILGHVYTLSDRVSDAETIIPATIGSFEERGVFVCYSLFLTWLAEMYLYGGRIEKARHNAMHALEFACAKTEKGGQAWALRLLGDIHANDGGPDSPREAERCYREALDLAEQCGMRPLIAHCRLGLGRLFQKTAREVEGQSELYRAAQMYREMDMAFYLEQTEAQIPVVH